VARVITSMLQSAQFDEAACSQCSRRGRLRASLDVATIQRDINVAQYEKAIQTAFEEVANDLAARGTYDDQVAALERDVAAAQRFLDLAQQRFENGVDSYLNVLTAQTTLYSAQQALVSAQLARLATLVNLYKDLGGGWIEHTGDAPAAEDIGSLAPPENHAPCGTYCRQSGRRRPTARWLPDRYAYYRLRHRAHLILPASGQLRP
jgi:hypothetical protein